MLRFTELLIHSDDVPVAARAALSSALTGPDDQRCDNLLEAAQILHLQTALEPEEIRDLIGLGEDCDCGVRQQA